ncbi:MAG TPA: type 1 glutamine amidotransferase [Phycisphaerales bacterium]|nr:type 1 glutamine amidotransferase [Phycisphaerales bacterium]
MTAPIIGITPDVCDGKLAVSRQYADAIIAHGAVPVILSCEPGLIPQYLELCDGFVFTGGDDPDMTRFGVVMHHKAKAMDAIRQNFEMALLEAIDSHPDIPVLGVCLGMQLMGLHAGGTLDQHLPDTRVTAGDHSNRNEHVVHGEFGTGTIHSHHHQALSSPGSLTIVAKAHDGVIEAVRDSSRAFYLGVQWHPERTDQASLGSDLFRRLVDAARAVHRSRGAASRMQSVRGH